MLNQHHRDRLAHVARGSGRIIALTGAGISAESGIPTFRGEEGYWTAGSSVYHPTEMATQQMFRSHPEYVWPWYLYRRGVCRTAQPNGGHRGLAELDGYFGDRFLVVTQNVDGLHLRAGSPTQRTFEIHGNIDFMRCSVPCSDDLFEIPDSLNDWPKDRIIDDDVWSQLVCPRCGARSRPHVLWFDEYYDENLYRFESSLSATHDADLLLVIGTSGATNLPNHMVRIVAQTGALLIDINPAENPFGQLAERLENGIALRGSSGTCLPDVIAALTEPRTDSTS